jgi:hypothetical protein
LPKILSTSSWIWEEEKAWSFPLDPIAPNSIFFTLTPNQTRSCKFQWKLCRTSYKLLGSWEEEKELNFFSRSNCSQPDILPKLNSGVRCGCYEGEEKRIKTSFLGAPLLVIGNKF